MRMAVVSVTTSGLVTMPPKSLRRTPRCHRATTSIGLVHRLRARVGRHELPVAGGAVALVPVVPADGDTLEPTIRLQHPTDRRVDTATSRRRRPRMTLSVSFVDRLGRGEEP